MATFRKVKTGWEAQVAKAGVRKSKTLPNKALAQKWAMALELELMETLVSGRVSAGGLTIAGLIRRYQETEADWSLGKLNSLRRATHSMGSMKIADLTQLTVMAWATNRSPYAMSTNVHLLKTLAGAIHYARKVLAMDVSPEPIHNALAALTASGKITHIRHRDRRVTPTEEALLVANWQCNLVTPDVVAFLIDTPMRSGEMVNLQWDDVAGEVVTIRDRKDPKRKIGNHQRIPLLGRSQAVLSGRNTRQPFPWIQSYVGRAITAAAKAAGLEDLRCHDLRHEGISRLFDAGWTIPQMALVSGHKKWGTLQRYTHIRAEDLLNLGT